MVFTKRLRDGVRRGRIRCSIRIWTRPHVKVGGRYPMDEGQIVVDSIVPIRRAAITADLARESGFDSVKDLLEIAQHGKGDKTYLIRFHYLPPGGWDTAVRRSGADGHPDHQRRPSTSARTSTLLRRIAASTPPALAGRKRTRKGE